jgi:serine/threonine-protein kinase
VAHQAADVFISYKAEDRSRLKPLVDALEAQGFSVWWDTQIGGGSHWREEIQEHLEAAKCVIVVWSKRSVGHEGHFVRDEASRAQRRSVYLPIRIDAVEPPLGFGEVQAISLKGWRGDRSDTRFLALADAIRECVTGEHFGHHRRSHEQGISRRVVVAGGAGVAAAAVGVLAAWEYLKPSVASAPNSIAVLPFANLSGDPTQTYFSDGMAEELRTSLARLDGLKVIARTSSEIVGKDDVKIAAKKLGAANVLIGSVRRSVSTIRVTAQLIDGRSGIERWSQDYDRAQGDTIKIQTDIAQSVAEALKIALGSTGVRVLTLGGTSNVDAQNLVLQADALLRSIFNENRARRGLELIDAAIALDANYAGAHARRALLLNSLSMFFSRAPGERKAGGSQALQSAMKAIALAPTLGWAHLALAQIHGGQLQFGPAWREYREALALGPGDASTMRFYSDFLADVGRKEEALELADRAIVLDPLSAESYNFRMFALYRARRYAEVERTGRELSLRSPGPVNLPSDYRYSLIMLGKLDGARQSFAQAPANDPGRVAGEGIIASRSGNREAARLAIAKLEAAVGDDASYSVAQIHAQLGEVAEAFAALERAFGNADWALIHLLTDPLLDPIRGDSRYGSLLSRLNFP